MPPAPPPGPPSASGPSIACIAIIGPNNTPLHTSLFPTPPGTPEKQRNPLTFSLLLSSTLDLFSARAATKQLDQDFGLLQAVDERLGVYGWVTGTGVKFVAVVDVGGASGGAVGVREGDVKPVFRALQSAYVALLQNPFYDPDEGNKVGSGGIRSRRFVNEVRRIGENWRVGGGAL